MTAVNVVLQPDRGFMLTDAAFYDIGGNVTGFGMKAFPIPNLKAVIAIRGAMTLAPYLAAGLSIGYRDFDDLSEQIGSDMFRWLLGNQHELMATGFPNFELHILGWSEGEKRAKHFVWQNSPDLPDEDLCALVETTSQFGNISLSPAVTESEFMERLPKVGTFLAHPEFSDIFDPHRDGLAILEAQRRQVEAVPELASGEAVSIVGGFAMVSEVTREGVSQRVIHRWKDIAGQPIVPAPFVDPRPFLSTIRPANVSSWEPDEPLFGSAKAPAATDRVRIEARRLKEKRARKAAQKNQRRA